jgi:hypothetical protein
MNVTKVEYNLKKFNQENVEALLESLGLDVNNYLLSMTKPSMLSRTLVGNIVDFSSRYCIICFSETEINLIMLSRLDSKKVTETIKINRDEINDIRLSNVIISYMLNIKLSDSNMKFQVFKKVGKFTKINSALEVFKQIY